MVNMFHACHAGTLDVRRLNYGIITLVPKIKDARQIQKFGPICLLNVSFKIITKVLMNRLSKVIRPIISLNQTTFIKGRYIMEGVVVSIKGEDEVAGNDDSFVAFPGIG